MVCRAVPFICELPGRRVCVYGFKPILWAGESASWGLRLCMYGLCTCTDYCWIGPGTCLVACSLCLTPLYVAWCVVS
jgi:hypothetical protein